MPDITIKNMYHLAPIITLPEIIDLPATSGPNSMYRLEPFGQVGGFSSCQAVNNGVSNGLDSNSSDVVQQLSTRQEAVMQKLQRLQQQLDQLKAKQMQDRKNASASVFSAVTDVPQFQQQAVVAGLNKLREHLVMLLKHQRTQVPDRNMDFPNSEDKSLERTRQHIHSEQIQLLERLQSLRIQIIALTGSQALEDDGSSSQLPKKQPDSTFNPMATGVGSVTAVNCCKQEVTGGGTAVNSNLFGSKEDGGVAEQSYRAIAETHATLLAILSKLREQVLQLPLLVHKATNTASAATATPAVLEQQHHAVLHKLLLLQHQLSDVVLKLPGCPTWPLPGSEAGVCHDLVISASPHSPPYSVLAMAAALRAVGYTVLTTAAIHSSIDPNTVPLALSSEFCSSSTGSGSRGDHQVVLSFVWSAVPRVTLMVNPLAQCSICGEGNVLRYLSRLLPASSPYHYEADASFAAIARTDLVLDDCMTLLAAAPTDKRAIGQFVKRMDEALKKSSAGDAGPVFGAVGDVAVWSALKQLQERGTKLPPVSLKWLSTVANSIVAGLLAGSRVRDAFYQPPIASASPPLYHEKQDSTCISGISNFNYPGWKDMSSCNRDDHNFSEGFWSTPRPIVCENCNDVHNLDDDYSTRASYSDCQGIENTIPPKQMISETNLQNSKSELVSETNSLPSDCQDSTYAQTSLSLLPHPDSTCPYPPSSGSSDGHVQYGGFVARLHQLGIEYQLRHHASVMTVDQLMENVGDMPGLHMKNLFLRDKKKKKTLYLVCARHNAKVQLNKVGKQVGCRELRFTDRDVLYSVLGVEPGHVTAYALINDVRNVVTLVLDEAVTHDKQQIVNFHPMVNTATLGMSSRDLLSFIEFTGHKPLFMKFEDV